MYFEEIFNFFIKVAGTNYEKLSNVRLPMSDSPIKLTLHTLERKHLIPITQRILVNNWFFSFIFSLSAHFLRLFIRLNESTNFEIWRKIPDKEWNNDLQLCDLAFCTIFYFTGKACLINKLYWNILYTVKTISDYLIVREKYIYLI